MDCPLCAKVRQPPAAELVWEFPHSLAFLGPWQAFTGYCVLVAKSHQTELFHLDLTERHAFLEEMNRLAQAIAAAFRPRKMNYELLGNQVPHLHWHLFPRYEDDARRLYPVWLAIAEAEADSAMRAQLETGGLPRDEIVQRLRDHLR